MPSSSRPELSSGTCQTVGVIVRPFPLPWSTSILMLFDEHFLLSIIFLFSHVLVSVFYMSFGHRRSPREVMRDWLAYTEEDNCWERAARAVRDYQLETPVRDHGYDSSRLYKSRTQTTGRSKRRLDKHPNLEGDEEALQITHVTRSS